jgi:3',5'-cyclic AMP phosphodiesterase CpdA
MHFLGTAELAIFCILRKKSKRLNPVTLLGFLSCFICMLLWAGPGWAADPRNNVQYPGQADDVLYFLHISDIHLGHTCGSDPSPNLRAMLSLVESGLLAPAFVAATGDLSDGTVCYQAPGRPCICGAPNGPIFHQWEDYAYILADYPATKAKYYDLPGNHDRYGSLAKAQLDWRGQTGRDGYAYLAARGSMAPFMGARDAFLEGQFTWESQSPVSGTRNLFQALNTTDESGIAFGQYLQMGTIYKRGPISDMPVLSSLELADAYLNLDKFRESPDSGLAFLLGHHPLITEESYPELPGLYDGQGLVGALLSKDAVAGASTVDLQSAGGFPQKGSGWINIGLDKWDEFSWTGRQGNALTGCAGIDAAYPAGAVVAASRPDRGAGEIIALSDRYKVSAYLYGHTHRSHDLAHWVLHPGGADARVLALSTGSLWEGWFRLVALDNRGMATRMAHLDDWPLVLITAPVDAGLGGDNPFYAPIPQAGADNVVRALVFYPPEAADLVVQFTASGGQQNQPCLPQGVLEQTGRGANLFQAELDLRDCALNSAESESEFSITVNAGYTDVGGERREASHSIKAVVRAE